MKNLKKMILLFAVPFILLLLSPELVRAATYTDYSLHRIKTGEFYGETSVNNALQRLTGDTGWWATNEATGRVIPYYYVFSGDYYKETDAAEVVKQFRASTGIDANYEPTGGLVPYQKIITGTFYGENQIKSVVQDFTSKTGHSAYYEKTGEFVYKNRLVSGGFIGEANTKSILEQFKKDTGIPATYEPTGDFLKYYKFTSGDFYGEKNAKSVLSSFLEYTGLQSTIEPSKYSNGISVFTGWFQGENTVKTIVNQMQTDLGLTVTYEPTEVSGNFRIRMNNLAGESFDRATSYLDQKGWWYETKVTDVPVATHYRIVSQSTPDQAKLDKASKYFSTRNWWYTIDLTGEKGDAIYRIVSNPLTSEFVQKGLHYFNQRGWWITTQATTEKDDEFYRIITEPLLNSDIIGKYFSKNGWWYKTQNTSQMGYDKFRLKSLPIFGDVKRDQAMSFFAKNGLSASWDYTGNSEKAYIIVTGTFMGYENAVNNANMVSSRYGWWTTTEKVFNGRQETYTNYNMTLSEMVQTQMTRSPQTDKYRNDPLYVYSKYISNNKIIGDNVYVRYGPGTNYGAYTQVDTGFSGFRILGYEGEWTKIAITWRNATPSDVEYYLNPNNFSSSSLEYFQFLKLSKPADINVVEVNDKILNSTKGILNGTAGIFAEAGRTYGINELYLISHALLETGNGKSALANGVMYNGVKVYNMYGYGAYDSCPLECGAKKAYEEGWFTPEQAIIGGARLIGSGYIYNSTFQQDTLYKMRWNPVVPYHQYATDIGWAVKQAPMMYNLYKMLENYTLYIDIPVYK